MWMSSGLVPVLALLALPTSAFAAHAGAPSGLTGEVVSAHFDIHFHDSGEDAVTAAQAGGLRDTLEHAFSVYVAPGPLNFPPPVDDGDGRVDVYIDTASGIPARAIADDRSATTGSAWILLNRDMAVDVSTATGTVAHEFFHVVQDAVWREGSSVGRPVVEATANWASVQATGLVPNSPQYVKDPGAPLDCPATTCDTAGNSNGYGQWPFFEFLSERFGQTVVRQIYDQEKSSGAGHMMDSVAAVLAANGSSLEQGFSDFSDVVLGAAWEFTPLKDYGPNPDARITPSELTSGATASRSLVVDHLASRYVRIDSASCHARPEQVLRLSIALPAGSTGRPAFAVLNSDETSGPVQPLTVADGTAQLAVPFALCAEVGVVMLPNPSRTADGQSFVLEASVTAPPPASAPRITAKVSKRVLITGKHPRLRFQVSSTGPGRLLAVLRSRPVTKRFTLRTGVNRLSLALPSTLRPGRHKLTLTSLSTAGRHGGVLRRTITVKRR